VRNFDFGSLKVVVFIEEVNARTKRRHLMEKNMFYDIVLVLIFVFNAKLLLILFLVHYKYDSISYMDFGAFW
jgi:hypothetical protein